MKITGYDLKRALKSADITQSDAAIALGMSRQTLSSHLKSAELPDALIQNVKDKLKIRLQNVKQYLSGELQDVNNSSFSDVTGVYNAIQVGEIPSPEDLKEKTTKIGNNKFLKLIPLVPLDIHAGYIEHYNDIPYLNDNFELFPFIATSPGHGNYMAFIIKGHSMDDGTPDAITEGCTVVGREIQRHHWRNKLHLHRFEDYVIIHKEIMTCKRITEHDTDNGIIHCTSINPDKIKYRDFDLSLDDCVQIFNIISVTKNR